MIGYKATDVNGCCRGFKFEVGKTYTKDTPKEELEKEASVYANAIERKASKEIVQIAYIDAAEPREKRIEELEEKISVLLSCKNCPDNKGGYICQKEYEDKCLAQKIQYIKELKEENAELKAQIEKMKKYGKLLQDICDVMGNDPYMVWRGLEQRVLILWDKSEEEKGLKMADDILERLLKISAIDWAEIEKWEIKENEKIHS